MHWNKLAKILWVIVLLIVNNHINASTQNSAIFLLQDSLKSIPNYIQVELEKKKTKEKLSFLIDLIEQKQYTDNQLAINCAYTALKLSQKSGYQIYEAKSLFWVASLILDKSVYSNNLDLLHTYTDIAADILKKADEYFWLIRCQELLATISAFQSIQSQVNKPNINKMNQAKRYINNSIQLYQQKGVKEEKKSLFGHLLTTKAAIYYETKPDSALTWWKEAELIFERENDSIGIARVNLNKGMFAKENNSYHFEKSISIYKKVNNLNGLKRAYLRYGTFCVQQDTFTKSSNLWDKGVSYLHKGLTLLGEENTCDALNRLGHAYNSRKKNKPETSFAEVDSSKYYFAEAIYRSKLEQNAYCLKEFLNDKLATCIRNNNCPLIIKDINSAYSDILNAREIVITQAVREKEQYTKQLKVQEEKRKRDRLSLSAVGLILGLSVIFFLLHQRQRIQNLKNKTKAQEAQIQALGARMNPHFISNTLNAIDSMIITDKKVEASKYLVDFAKLSRSVLENSESVIISLKKELEVLNYYITLEEMRFENKLTFELNIDNKLDLETIYIPPMLLQPFVENAVLHGIQPKKSKGKITITIRSNSNNQLECIIQDNGVGRAKSVEIQKQSMIKRQSYSMEISKDRINLINTINGAQLNIEDLFEQGEPSGTKVVITLPKNLNGNG